MDLPKGNRVVRFMSVIAVVLVSNLMTYTFCVHGNNFYNSESMGCDTLRYLYLTSKTERSNSEDPALDKRSLTNSLESAYQPSTSSHEELDNVEENLNAANYNLPLVGGDESTDIRDYPASSRYGESNEFERTSAPTGPSECEPCQCNESVIENVVYARQKTASDCANELPTENNDIDLATIFIITPTHQRDTQKVDLTSMCHTLMNVPRVVWIIIEDAPKPTSLVTNLIQRCKAEIVHLLAYTSAKYRVEKGDHAWSKPRGVEQRNAGLSWLRQHYSPENCSGIVYFGDDDNKYDLRLFDDIRKTKQVSVWKVAWSGGVRWEGPTCHNGYAKSWHAAFAKNRALPVDMAAFSIHLCEFFKHPKAQIGVNIHGDSSKQGYLETDLLEHFTNRSAIECRGSENETYVWHSHTRAPNVQSEKREKSSNAIET